MTEHWQHPVSNPILTTVWTETLLARDHQKPTAMGTRFRYSNAMNCSRRLVFDALGVRESDPIDPAGIHVTTIGTWIHEQMQAAVAAKYPGATFEVKSSIKDLVSGSADGVIDVASVIVTWNGGKISWEIKSIGGFGFKKAIGMAGRGYKRGMPEGPRIGAIAQCALNAKGNDCDTCIVSYISLEAVSKQAAQVVGLSEFDRFTAEWHIPREVWEPLADAEIARLDYLDDYYVSSNPGKAFPHGDAYEDGEWRQISPNDARRHWSCEYCPHLNTCLAVEDGALDLPL